MKLFSVVIFALSLTACGLIPDKFDNAEYSALVWTAVYAENAQGCDPLAIHSVWLNTSFLEKYSKNTMNENSYKIYAELNDLASELKDRDNASDVYCNLKWKNISKVTEKAVSMSGSRMK